jgi:hypothetical protein
MLVMLAIGFVTLCETKQGQLGGLWRILDGNVESGLMSDSELQDGSPRLCQLRTASVGPCCNKHLVVY